MDDPIIWRILFDNLWRGSPIIDQMQIYSTKDGLFLRHIRKENGLYKMKIKKKRQISFKNAIWTADLLQYRFI